VKFLLSFTKFLCSSEWFDSSV